MTASCLYEGRIRHRRFAERHREFSHPVTLAYIDLDELPGLLGGRLTASRPGLLRFRRPDYFGDPGVSLAGAVRDAVHAGTGARPEGPIRVLTQLRSYGLCFNPVSFYYCMDAGGDRPEAVVAEVTNTPWGERHAYVLDARRQRAPVVRGEFDKALHVSPFMGMDHAYAWSLSTPARTLSVHIESRRGDELAFDATLSLHRRELTRASARRLSVRFPFASVRVLALIYAHALGLRLRGVAVHPHPRSSVA